MIFFSHIYVLHFINTNFLMILELLQCIGSQRWGTWRTLLCIYPTNPFRSMVRTMSWLLFICELVLFSTSVLVFSLQVPTSFLLAHFTCMCSIWSWLHMLWNGSESEKNDCVCIFYLFAYIMFLVIPFLYTKSFLGIICYSSSFIMLNVLCLVILCIGYQPWPHVWLCICPWGV